MNQKVTWLSYEFQVYEYSAQWNTSAGIYIFAGQDQQDQWVALYVGQAGKFYDRIPSHEKWEKAQLLGATHVHAMVVPQPYRRQAIEAELIRDCQPVLNVQMK